MIVLAHLSDLHIDGGERSIERAAQVMTYLDNLTEAPDAILVTGDLADRGNPGEYKQVQELLSTSVPVLTCPGNHDVRENYRAVLLNDDSSGDAPAPAPINQVHEVAGAVIAMCDSTIPGRDDGYLADETIEWLDGVLTTVPAETPAFVCFHHPPVILHAPYVDAIRQQGEQRLADVLARHPQVVAVLCGHAHLAGSTTFAKRPLLVAPGVASTVKLAWEPGDIVNYDLPPAIAFHVLDDDRRLMTHYRLVARASA